MASDDVAGHTTVRLSPNFGLGWEHLPGRARFVSMGADGTVFHIGDNGSIWRWNESSWDSYSGLGVGVAVDHQGNPWHWNQAGEMYRWVGDAWQQVPGWAGFMAIGGDG